VFPHCYKGSALILNLFFNKLDDVTNTEQDRTVKCKEQRIKIPARSQEKKKGDKRRINEAQESVSYRKMSTIKD